MSRLRKHPETLNPPKPDHAQTCGEYAQRTLDVHALGWAGASSQPLPRAHRLASASSRESKPASLADVCMTGRATWRG